MSGFGGVLDVVIGMSFVYLLLSMVCSGANELIAWAINLRANTLKHGIDVLLQDPRFRNGTVDLTGKVLAHPLIKGICPGKPSYLPSSTFVLALLDTVSQETDGEPGIDTMDGIKSALDNLDPKSSVRRQLELFIDAADTDVAAYRKRLESWFDDSMDRVSGLYKRRVQWISLAVGLSLAFATGIDSGTLANALMHNDALRQTTAAAAVEYMKAAAPPVAAPAASAQPAAGQAAGNTATVSQATTEISNSLATLDKLDLPIGIPYLRAHASGEYYWLLRIAGIIFTGLAVALGSPFWFDMLGKLINLRLSGDPPPTSLEKQAAANG